MKRLVRILTIAAVVAAGAAAIPSSAATGTFTKITTPKGPGQPLYRYLNYNTSSSHTLNIAGQASIDVANVNVYCFTTGDTKTTTSTPLNAAPLPVSGGAFNGTLTLSETDFPCVLRALPDSYTGLDGAGGNNDYVGAFSGPTYFEGGFATTSNTSSRLVAGVSLAAQKRALAAAGTVDAFGVYLQVSNDDLVHMSGPLSNIGDLRLLGGNLTTSGTPTKSAIVIDNLNAYAPATLDGFVADHSQVPAITFSKSRNLTTGVMTISEVDPLRSCAGNAYPQGTGTCTPVATGVSFKRTLVTSAEGAVMTVHDSFVSTNGHAHSLKIEYSNIIAAPNQGQPGIRRPGQSSFQKLTAGQTITSFPVGPHTILTTTDLYAADNSIDRVDGGITYSGRPASLFEADASNFGLRYARTIPAGRSANFAFAQEVGFAVSSVNSLAAAAQKALTPHLALTAPALTTSDNTPTIRGKITNATNGLPAKVTITIGTTSKTANVSSTGAFAITWTHLANGKHTAKAKATDPSGFKLAASRTFKVT